MLISLLLESAHVHDFGLLETPEAAWELDTHGQTDGEGGASGGGGGPGLLKRHTLQILELTKVVRPLVLFQGSLQTLYGSSAARIAELL